MKHFSFNRLVPPAHGLFLLNLVASLFFLGSLRPVPAANTRTDTRPNIVFILADDLGWTDLGCQGSTYYRTPHIDQLATEGMRLSSFGVFPNCAPTRASIMSGQYAPRTGVYTVNTFERGKAENRKMNVPRNETNLPLDTFTMAQALQSAGYATAMFGKWHLGNGPQYHPSRRGFDESFVTTRGHFNFKTTPPVKTPEGVYLADFITDHGLRFMEKNRDHPFFLYLPHFAVHSPYHAKKELIAEFKKRPQTEPHRDPTYAAMIASVDESVGRVMAKLKELNLEHNTVLIFSSDNGGVGGYYGTEPPSKRRGITDNAPLRGGKGTLYEGGIRVPFIVRWPAVIEPSTQCNEPTVHVDLYPTFLELAGAMPKPGYVLDGQSLLPLWRSPQASLQRDAIYWHFPGYLESYVHKTGWRTTPVSVIRSGPYKLMEFFETGRVELYNLTTDLGEQKNLASVMPEKTSLLHGKLKSWRRELQVAMPTMKD